MPITALPTPPSPSDSPAAFNSKAFDLLGALPTFVTEANGLQAENAAAAASSATTAANAALASKLDAANPSYTGTLTGGTGVVNIGSGQFVKDAAGNVGVGVPPSAWGSSWKVIDISSVLGLMGGSATSIVSHNMYANASAQLIYKTTNYASYYQQQNGTHSWYTAPSGTAGNAITFTQAMTLDASGSLTIKGQYSSTGAWAPNADSVAGSPVGYHFYGNGSKALSGAITIARSDYTQAGTGDDWADGVGIHIGGFYQNVGGRVPLYFGSGFYTPVAMTLNSSGNLLVGGTSNAANARALIEGTSGYTLGLRHTGIVTWYLNAKSDASFAIDKDGSETARFDSSGNLLVGTTSNTNNAKFLVVGGSSVGNLQAGFGGSNGTSLQVYHADIGGSNGANTVLKVEKVNATGRSINAGGTINASGADYAEYEHNNGLTIAKGSIVGFKADGTLTLTFADAIRFGIKSTSPSYVGGDTWGSEDAVGKRPEKPTRKADVTETTGEGDEAVTTVIEAGDTDEEWQAKQDAYEADLALFNEALEAARQLVDRIAYSGKVPCNVTGATPGDYIVASAADDGSITGTPVAEPDFAQYRKAIGRVNRLLPDGRCEVAVIVH